MSPFAGLSLGFIECRRPLLVHEARNCHDYDVAGPIEQSRGLSFSPCFDLLFDLVSILSWMFVLVSERARNQ